MRLDDSEYKTLIDDITAWEEIDTELLTNLSVFHMECDARRLEAFMEKRSGVVLDLLCSLKLCLGWRRGLTAAYYITMAK